MPITSNVKNWANRRLERLNLRIETRTAERVEKERLLSLERAGHFSGQAFPLLPQMSRCDPSPILAALKEFREQTNRFDRHATGGEYSFANQYFTSPDAEVAYALVRTLWPKRIVEVGSGNSTRLFREAVKDGGLNTKLVSIDPFPRVEVETVADQVIRKRLEHVAGDELQALLECGDFLFIDSSHEVRTGNDVVSLFLRVVPGLKKGVVIHIHDIFLPFEYPSDWIIHNTLNVDWAEQYLVQAMLQASDHFEILWAGHFFQKTLGEFQDYFPSVCKVASSLWLRKLV